MGMPEATAIAELPAHPHAARSPELAGLPLQAGQTQLPGGGNDLAQNLSGRIGVLRRTPPEEEAGSCQTGAGQPPGSAQSFVSSLGGREVARGVVEVFERRGQDAEVVGDRPEPDDAVPGDPVGIGSEERIEPGRRRLIAQGRADGGGPGGAMIQLGSGGMSGRTAMRGSNTSRASLEPAEFAVGLGQHGPALGDATPGCFMRAGSTSSTRSCSTRISNRWTP